MFSEYDYRYFYLHSFVRADNQREKKLFQGIITQQAGNPHSVFISVPLGPLWLCKHASVLRLPKQTAQGNNDKFMPRLSLKANTQHHPGCNRSYFACQS